MICLTRVESMIKDAESMIKDVESSVVESEGALEAHWHGRPPGFLVLFWLRIEPSDHRSHRGYSWICWPFILNRDRQTVL